MFSSPTLGLETQAGIDAVKMLTAEISRSDNAVFWNHIWEIISKIGLWVMVVAVASITSWVTNAPANSTRLPSAKVALAGGTALVAVLGGMSAAGLDFAKRKETWQIRKNHLETCLYAIKDQNRRKEKFDAAIEKIRDWGDATVADPNISCAPKVK